MIIGEYFRTRNTPARGIVVRQLGMDKALAIKHLAQAGYSERKIAEQLGISRKAVRYHLGQWLKGYQGAHRRGAHRL